MMLVFGGGGQLGGALRALAAETGAALSAPPRALADIADPAQVEAALAAARPGIVVNAAGYTAVDRAEREPDAAMRANALGPAVLARACANRGLPLIHISTDYVFDGAKTGPYVETDPIAPIGVYGRSKAEGETAVRAAHEQHVILRTSWVYGVYGANILKTILKLAAERDELRFVDDQRGCPTSTRDLAVAIFRTADAIRNGAAHWGVYHFAGEGATTWRGFAEHAAAAQERHTGRKVTVTPIRTQDFPALAQRPANSALDSSLFARVYGVRARPWREAVDEAVDTLFGGRGE
ncbi:MAG: dTDP-4-dehydrorhamnose reductase [Maricaulaceae bacterium]|nr:dTDP-4-dehydrorhamnose reductase [Maricaulaceae bacterium]